LGQQTQPAEPLNSFDILEAISPIVYLKPVAETNDTFKRIIGTGVRQLTVHPDERGQLFEILRVDDPEFQKFGQVYITTAHPGIIKGWHCHEIQTDHFCLIKGRAIFALYDARSDSATQGQVDVIECSEDHPQLIVIPPRVYHGFKNTGTVDAICLNCPTEPYNADDPDEQRLDPFDSSIPFDWKIAE
jgi:dTDP-4-dehydrorhamnose 3,5-epimerase